MRIIFAIVGFLWFIFALLIFYTKRGTIEEGLLCLVLSQTSFILWEIFK